LFRCPSEPDDRQRGDRRLRTARREGPPGEGWVRRRRAGAIDGHAVSSARRPPPQHKKDVPPMGDDEQDHDEPGTDAEFVDDAIDDDEVSPDEQLVLDKLDLDELSLTLDDPEGFAPE